ncbi:MAG: hypothetical protein ABTQ29_12180 [Siculibacillus sp.]
MRIGQTLGVSIGSGIAARATTARRVEPIDRPASARPRPEEPASRALVVTEPRPLPESPTERLARHRTHAPFLAQLLATRDDLPVTRRLRRADPRRACAAYTAVEEGESPAVPGWLVDVSR